jgi:hypothetical protein
LHLGLPVQEYVEVILCKPEQLTVLLTGPCLISDGPELESLKYGNEWARKEFVDQNAFHTTFSSSARAASSREATACSRRTVGKLSRCTSRLDPLSPGIR